MNFIIILFALTFTIISGSFLFAGVIQNASCLKTAVCETSIIFLPSIEKAISGFCMEFSK